MNRVKKVGTPKRIFVSHSTRDNSIVRALVNLLEVGMGIPSNVIFCSSIPGQGIKPGFDIVSGLYSELCEAELVLFLITQNFYDSPYCMCELGAAWGMQKRYVPLVSPPLAFKDLRGTITGIQAIALESRSDLDILRDLLVKVAPSKKRTSSMWFETRQEFHNKLPMLLSQYNPARLAGEAAIAAGMPVKIDKVAEVLSRIVDAGSADEKIWALVLDVDKLTQLNHRFGYRIGNKILENISTILADTKSMVAAERCGDDTFFGITICRQSDVLVLAETIRHGVSNIPSSMGRPEITVSVSIGAAAYDGRNIQSWLQRAHASAISLKNKGGNASGFWQPRHGQRPWS